MTLAKFPHPDPLPRRLITLDCPICEQPTPFAETESRDAFVCGICGCEYRRIVMDYPPLQAYVEER